MPTYWINGKKYYSDSALTPDELDELSGPSTPTPKGGPLSGYVEPRRDDVLRDVGRGVVGLAKGGLGAIDIATSPLIGDNTEWNKLDDRPWSLSRLISKGQQGLSGLNDYFDTWATPEAKTARQEVGQAKTWGEYGSALARNPGIALDAVLESGPSMYAGAKIGQGILSAAPKVAPYIATGAGEGFIGAGQQAAQTRDDTGELTPIQALIAAGSGGIDALISMFGGKAAQKLGLPDPDVILADPNATGSRRALARIGAGGLEGVEEGGQSWQEQAASNLAAGRPITQGTGTAAAMGSVTGGIMGSAVSGGGPKPPAPPPSYPPEGLKQLDLLTGVPPDTMGTQQNLPFPQRNREAGDREVRWANEPYLPYNEGPQQQGLGIEPIGGSPRPLNVIPPNLGIGPIGGTPHPFTMEELINQALQEGEPPTVPPSAPTVPPTAAPSPVVPPSAPAVPPPVAPQAPPISQRSNFDAAGNKLQHIPREKVDQPLYQDLMDKGWKLINANDGGFMVFVKKLLAEDEGAIDADKEWTVQLAKWIAKKYRERYGRDPSPRELENRISVTKQHTGSAPLIPDAEEAGYMDADTAKSFIEDATAAVNFWKKRQQEARVDGDGDGENFAINQGSKAHTTLRTLLERTGDLNPTVPPSQEQMDASQNAALDRQRLNKLVDPLWRAIINNGPGHSTFLEASRLINGATDPDTINEHVGALREWYEEAQKDDDFDTSEMLSELLEEAVDHQRAILGEGTNPPDPRNYDDLYGPMPDVPPLPNIDKWNMEDGQEFYDPSNDPNLQEDPFGPRPEIPPQDKWDIPRGPNAPPSLKGDVFNEAIAYLNQVTDVDELESMLQDLSGAIDHLRERGDPQELELNEQLAKLVLERLDTLRWGAPPDTADDSGYDPNDPFAPKPSTIAPGEQTGQVAPFTPPNQGGPYGSEENPSGGIPPQGPGDIAIPPGEDPFGPQPEIHPQDKWDQESASRIADTARSVDLLDEAIPGIDRAAPPTGELPLGPTGIGALRGRNRLSETFDPRYQQEPSPELSPGELDLGPTPRMNQFQPNLPFRHLEGPREQFGGGQALDTGNSIEDLRKLKALAQGRFSSEEGDISSDVSRGLDWENTAVDRVEGTGPTGPLYGQKRSTVPIPDSVVRRRALEARLEAMPADDTFAKDSPKGRAILKEKARLIREINDLIASEADKEITDYLQNEDVTTPEMNDITMPPETEDSSLKHPTAQQWDARMRELDARGAPDTAYRDIMSTAGKNRLKKGETWRGRVLEGIKYFEGLIKRLGTDDTGAVALSDIADAFRKAKQYTGIGQGRLNTGKPKKSAGEYSFVKEALAFPTNLMTTLDLSAPGRQGLLLFNTPQYWTSLVKALPALHYETWKKVDADIRNRPNWEVKIDPKTKKPIPSIANRAGLTLFSPASELGIRNEQVASRWLETGAFLGPEKIFGKVDNPLRWGYNKTLGKGVRATNRFYITFSNLLQASRFDYLMNRARDMSYRALTTGEAPRPGVLGGFHVPDALGGFDIGFKKKYNTQEAMNLDPYYNDMLSREIGSFVGAAIGQAKAQNWLEKSVQAVGPVLFSPGLLNSRIRMLNPGTYLMASPYVRKQYLKAAIGAAMGWYIFTQMAKVAADAMGQDYEINYDHTSADFGKFRIGDTRLDFGGGFLQFAVLIGRAAEGGWTSSSNPEEGFHKFGEGFQPETQLSNLERFISNKFNPVLKFAYDVADAAENKPVYMGDRLIESFVPLFAQDVWELAGQDPELLPWLVPILFGAGTQTYSKFDKFQSEKETKFTDPERDWKIEGGGLRDLIGFPREEEQY